MLKARVFDITLFIIAIGTAVFFGHISNDFGTFAKALAIFWLFSCLYYQLRVIDKNGNTSIDYGINYGLSFGIFTGPLGLIIYEAAYYFAVYIYRKITKKAVKGDFLDNFYNVGAFTIAFSIAYYLYYLLYPSFQHVPFGFWILILLLFFITSLITDFFISTAVYLVKDFKTFKEALKWALNTRSLADMGKTIFTNGLMLLLLQGEKWEMLISLFLLNYFVSRSFVVKAHSIQNKLERDQFEKMAYTDFLTGIANRAFMDKKIKELNKTGEYVGVVVIDIDNFKRINDHYNHSVGDKVIQGFTQTIEKYLSKDDYLFRSGGEEFTIFLRNRTFDEGMSLVGKMRKGVAGTAVETEYNNIKISITYTASFGYYYYKVSEHVSMEKGYNYADNLLMESKQLGRNRVSAKNGLLYKENIQ